MGDYVYAFSGAGVSVTSYADMNTTATLELPGYESVEAYYYEDVAVSGESDGETSEDSSDSGESEGPPPKEDA